MNPTELASTIEQALQTVLDIDEYESTEGFEGKGIDISGDDWTWHIEDGLAYLAIDDEPDDPTLFALAIERNLTAPVIDTLQQIDSSTRRVLSDLLVASDDPLSLVFAEMLDD